MRRENVGCVIDCGRGEFQELPHHVLNRFGEGRQDINDTPHNGRNDKRHPVGISERIGLRQNGGKDHNEQRHEGRCIRDANFPVDLNRQLRGKGCRQNVHQGIAEQHRADHFLRFGQDAVDDLSLFVAVLFKRVHAGPGGGRQCRFAAIEKSRERDENNDREYIQSNSQGHETRWVRSVCCRLIKLAHSL